MGKITKLAILLILMTACLAVPRAQAVPVNYDFTVTAMSGPLTGTTATGTFAFDDTIIPPGGGGLFALNLLTDLAFTWNGIAYDETTANTGALVFDAAGNLSNIGFGTNPFIGGFVVLANTESWGFAGTFFVYSVGQGAVYDDGLASYQRQAAVPEPGTLLLIGSGLLSLVGYGRKKFFKK